MIREEINALLSDPWQLSMVSWIPISLFLIMWLIFSQGVVTNIPIGVVDHDASVLSRKMIHQFDAHPSLLVKRKYANSQEAVRDLRKGEIYGLVMVPENLEKDIRSGTPPRVTAFINSQFLLMGKVINSALLSTQGTFSAQLDTVKNLAGADPVPQMAISAAAPIGKQITPLYNRNKDYAQFLLSAIFPAIWQILIVTTCIMSLAAERRRGKSNWLGDHPVQKIIARILFLGIIFLLQGIFYLCFLYCYLGMPMHGSWLILISAQALMVIATLSVATLLGLVIGDTARCLSISASYAAPALAFMGVTFPVTDMTLPARIWRSLLPVSHYIDIQFGQVNYGVPFQLAADYFLALALFLLILPVVFLLAAKTLKGSGHNSPLQQENPA